MALAGPSTSRSNITTPRRLPKPLTAAQTPECFSKVRLETPRSSRPQSTTTKDNKQCDELRNLIVAVRIRPMNTKELNNVGVTDCVIDSNHDELTVRSNITGGNSISLDHTFEYDHIFHKSDNEDVFEKLGKPLLDNAFRGFNACLFAYGQTGSGKSYSMMGDNTGDVVDIDNNAGITPRFCKALFKRIDKITSPNVSVSVEVSYFEIYNEKIHDLLATTEQCRTHALKVREHPVWGPYVVDLSVHPANTYSDLRSWLILGNRNRSTAATAMNEKSSRSHSIFTIEVSLAEGSEQGDVCRRSKVSLVDLAGSERLSNAMSNEERIKQGVSINKSLLTLGKVISALAEQKKGNHFIPYRESVLTWLLKESLGGNSLTSMLATISPASCNTDETLATLRYACQARSIVNRARINENPHDKLIRELRAEVERLRALRQTYERSSFISSPICLNNSKDEHDQELERLREELKSTEDRLRNAEIEGEKNFAAIKEAQLLELTELEKRKEALASHLRVAEKIEPKMNFIPYKTNFLLDLKRILNTANGAKEYLDKRGNGEKIIKQEIINDSYEINENKNEDRDKSIKIEKQEENNQIITKETDKEQENRGVGKDIDKRTHDIEENKENQFNNKDIDKTLENKENQEINIDSYKRLKRPVNKDNKNKNKACENGENQKQRREIIDNGFGIKKNNDFNKTFGKYGTEEVLNKDITTKLEKSGIKTTMDQIYNAMHYLHPTVNESPENIKLMFARVNKLLQAFETSLTNSVCEGNTEKTVTFNV